MLLICPHSARWPTARMCLLPTLISTTQRWVGTGLLGGELGAHEGLTNRFCVPLDQNFRQATLIFPLTIAPLSRTSRVVLGY